MILSDLSLFAKDVLLMIKRSKQALFVLLAMLLSLYLAPAAFATNSSTADSPPQALDDAGDPVTPDDPTPPTDTSDTDSLGDADTTVEPDAGMSGGGLFPVLPEEAQASAEQGLSVQSVAAPAVNYAPVKNTTTVRIVLPDAAGLTNAGADAVTFKAEMKYKGNTLRSVEVTHTITAADATTGFTIDLKDYGSFTVVAKFTTGGSDYYTTAATTVDVIADEYNIAPVSASLPVTFFSLSLWGENDIRHNQETGTLIPTIVMMERPLAWDWDKLPEGVYGLPYLTTENLTTQPSDFGAASDKFRANTVALNDYVKELYRISPNATFHLYVVDFYLGIIQTALYANKIPQGQYTITVLSDGSFSYSAFSGTYNQADPATTFNTHKDEWARARAYAYANGTVKNGYDLHRCNHLTYAAISQEPSATWWLARPALLETKGDGNAFGTEVQKDSNKVIRINIAALLAKLATSESESFKTLYNFSDEYFADAEKSGKDVMLFLGSTVTAEAGGFPDYAKFIMSYYGDRFVYYYKGHPGTPTDLHPSKQQELVSLGITDVDSSIAAELILFFYPDIYLSGYQSSTYASVSNRDMTKGLFATKKNAADSLYLDLMDFFVSPVDAATSTAVKEICKPDTKSYLVEFNDPIAKEKGYDAAIWEPATSTINYYRLFNDAYVRYQDNAQVVTIASSLAADKLVDMAGGSGISGANVQLYASNGSAAQRFQLIPDGNGCYTIMNLKSGKVLDVKYADKNSGTNVWQYAENGTDAQKWRVTATGDDDGSVHLISKLSDELYLDVSGAGTANGTNIQVYTRNGTKAQKFFIEGIQPALQDGAYTFRSKVGTNKVMDVAGGSHSSEANVQLYSSNGTDAQKFDVRFDAFSGYYVITNAGSGKVLDVRYAGSAPATNVWQYTFNNTVAQLWAAEKLADGSFTFQTALGSGHCLDVAGARSEDRTNIQVYPANGTNAQRWIPE
jgi:hypothetical protein